MKLLLPILFLFFTSCEIKSNKAEISSEPIKISYSEIKKENKKFVFVVIDYEDPKLHHRPGDVMYGVKLEELARTEWVKKRSCSNIKEYSNFTEDDGYRLMDQAKKDMSQFGLQYYLEVGNKVRDSELRDKIEKDSRRITNTKYLTFNSYKDASIARDRIISGE